MLILNRKRPKGQIRETYKNKNNKKILSLLLKASLSKTFKPQHLNVGTLPKVAFPVISSIFKANAAAVPLKRPREPPYNSLLTGPSASSPIPSYKTSSIDTEPLDKQRINLPEII